MSCSSFPSPSYLASRIEISIALLPTVPLRFADRGLGSAARIFPLSVAGVPIVREADVLALSSRNVYLSPDERRRALVRALVGRGAIVTCAGTGTAVRRTL